MHPARKGWIEEVATIQNTIQQLAHSLLEVNHVGLLSNRVGQDEIRYAFEGQAKQEDVQ